MPPTLPIHHVYTEQLFPLGHGFPLWDAEPEDKRFEVEIGTVGRIDSGKFWLLFNAMKPADDPYQKHGVPATHAPQGPWEKIKFPLVVSQTVCNRDIAAALQAGSADGSISLGGSLKFDCRENTGAFLLLERPAVALVLPAKDHIVRYMRDNFDHWLEFANAENGLSLRQEEIYFVHGTVKTSKWASGAFHGNCRNREGSVQAQFMEVGNFNLSVSISTEDYTRMEYNYGPTGRDLGGPSRSPRPAVTGSASAGAYAADSRKCDQCIFFNYYKAKRRFMLGPKYMAAAAGPHHLPSPDRDLDDPMHSTPVIDKSQWLDEDFEPDTISEPPCDPVDFLLDYILEHSKASIAIGCDTDLYSLFRDSGYPSDVAAALEEMEPIIHVDESGGGTVVVDLDVLDSQLPLVREMMYPSHREGSGLWSDMESEYTYTSGSSRSRTYVGSEYSYAGDQTPKPRKFRFLPTDHRSRESTLLGDWNSPEPGQWGDQKAHRYAPELKPLQTRQYMPRKLREQSQDDSDAGGTVATAVSSNGKWVAQGYDDGSIVLQEVAQRGFVCIWDGYPELEQVTALAFSHDGSRLASATEDGTITIWEVEAEEDDDNRIAVLRGHTEATTILAWSPDGMHIASASEDFTVRLWDAEAYQPLFLLSGHDEPLTVLKFSPNGLLLVSGGEDCFCLLWDVASGKLRKELYGHNDPVRAAEFDARSTRLVTCSDDTTARIWNVDTGKELLRLEAHRSTVWKAAFSRDGRRVLTVSSTTAKIHDSYTGDKKYTFKGVSAALRASQMLERRLE